LKIKFILYRFFIFISFYLYSTHVLCLDPNKSLSLFIIDNYTTENGLPQNSVLDILQSTDGYLWLATYEGLSRFDGVSFSTLSKSNSVFKKNDVFALTKGKGDSIWIGTNGGGLYLLEKNNLTLFSIKDNLSSNYISDLLVDNNGTLWVATRTGISKYVNGKFEIVDLGELSDKFFVRMCKDKYNNIWCASQDNGIVKIAKNHIRKFNLRSGLKTNHFGCISIVNDEVWAGTGDRGEIYRFKNNKWTVLGKKEGLNCDSVYTIYQDSDNSIWVGGNRNGIFRYTKNSFESISTEQGLTNDSVRVFFEDKEKSLWVGTYRGGLNRLRDGNIITYTHSQGLVKDEVRALFCDSEGTIWVGTVGGGLCSIKNNIISTISTKQGLPDNRIWSIAETKDKSILVGTYGGGAALLKNNKVVKVWNKKNGLENNIVRAVYEDSKGNFWFGTNGGGVTVISLDGKFKYLSKKNGLAGNYIYSFYEDSKNRMWVGTYEGGVSIIEKGNIENISIEDNLSSNCIWSIIEDSKGRIWMGTDNGGIVKIDNGKKTIYSEKDGLFSTSIFQLIDDKKGNLWVGGNKGPIKITYDSIEKYDRNEMKSLILKSYGKSEGMPEKECNGPAFPAGCLGKDGNIYFPTTKGVVVINPNNKTTNTIAPNVVIESVIVDGKQIQIKNNSITLEPGPKNIEIKYTALSLVIPKKVLFKYKIDNQKFMTNVGTRRIAFYTNLNYGKHIFNVIACNNDEIWNMEGASIKIYVKPHYYETLFFKLLSGIILFLFSIIVYKYKVRRLKEGKKKLEQLVNEKTEELQKVNQELKKIANTDWLTGIDNHRQFDSMYKNEWKRCARNKHTIALIMADIDNFKLYNDTYGHQEGDICLKRVATKLKNTLRRPADLVARYGGEEFVIVLPDTSKEGALKVGNRLKKGIESLNIKHKTSPITPHITISLGIATILPDFSKDSHELLIHADSALYNAKAMGKNQVCLYKG